MQATEQQQSIVEHGAQGVRMKVEALAGSGKTSTLIMMGNAMPRKRGLYLAFNKAIASEAQRKFPSNIQASTVHSKAFRECGVHYKDRIEGGDAGRLNPMRLVHHYRYTSVGKVQPLTRAGLVKQTLATFLASNDPIPDASHLPREDLVRMSLQRDWSAEDTAALKSTLVADTQRLWNDVLSDQSGLPLPHDAYLKLWVDSNPRLGVDCVMLDEAQDASDLMLRLITSQPSQIIMVGDRNQQIYSWRGAVNIMQSLDDMHTEYLSQSFRFGNRIAGAANEVLRYLDSPVLMHGFEADRSHLTSRALLYRTNAGVFGALMSRGLGKDKQKAHVAGGVHDLRKMLDAVEQLQRGQSTLHPDFIGFDNWRQVEEAAESYGAPAELRLVVKVVEKFPMSRLRQVLEEAGNVREEEADITLSTAHKAKGREWAEVGLGQDFSLPDTNPLTEEKAQNPEESRLNYVAVTRAQEKLYGAKEMLTTYMKRNKNEDMLKSLEGKPVEERVRGKMTLAPNLENDPEAFQRFMSRLDADEVAFVTDRLQGMANKKVNQDFQNVVGKEVAEMSRAVGPSM